MSNIRHPAGCRKQGTEMSEITEGIADILTMKQELVDAKETIEQLRRKLDTAQKQWDNWHDIAIENEIDAKRLQVEVDRLNKESIKWFKRGKELEELRKVINET